MNTLVANPQVKRMFGRDYYFLPDSYVTCEVYTSGPSFEINDRKIWIGLIDVNVDLNIRHPHMKKDQTDFLFKAGSIDVGIPKVKTLDRIPALSTKMISKIEIALILLNNFILAEFISGSVSLPAITEYLNKVMKKPPK